MNCFFDSSALVKRYVAEVGRDKVNALITEARFIAVSRLAYAEVLSALVKRRAAFEAADEEFSARLAAFREDWRSFAAFEMGAEALGNVDRVIETHKLRGADSIHLSTALWIRKAISPDLVLVASDKELLAAAQRERFATVDPRDFPGED